MQTRIMLFLFMVLLASGAISQSTIRGRVIGDNLSGGEVFIAYTTYKQTLTNSGEFEFKNLKPDSYFVSVFVPGYKQLVEKVLVGSNTTKTVEFRLVPLETELNVLVIEDESDKDFTMDYLKPIENMAIYAGKKTEVVSLDKINANLATNNARQIFSRVAGLNIWESDGAGIQLGIGGRGLSPNRVSNFNTRQNGYDISADALGYPESYYTPPTEALDRIEVVRGAASLQYGTQFGGFLNFKFKDPEQNKKFHYNGKQTVGSFNFFNTYNEFSGSHKKWSYFTYYQFKRGNGWRPNTQFNMHNAHAMLQYKASSKLTFRLEHTFMHYVAQQPGGLTDAQFNLDPRISTRERNWFSVDWNLTAFDINYQLSKSLQINNRTFHLNALRGALGFLGFINRADPLGNRDLILDTYKNVGNEFRVKKLYYINGLPNNLIVGNRLYWGTTYRKQGFANDLNTPDFYYLNPENPGLSDFFFPSFNSSFFAENIFQLSPKLSITPGIRYEIIQTESQGTYNIIERHPLTGQVLFEDIQSDNRFFNRSFFLAGVGASYKRSNGLEFYANLSQNYRAVTFNDMRIVNPNFRVDPNLQDERGFSSDFGIRGKLNKVIAFDASVFMIQYNNRIGSVLRTDSILYTTYRYRTNIANSRNLGVELFAETNLKELFKSKGKSEWRVFVNLSFLDANYYNSQEAAYEGKKVELVPNIIAKGGVNYAYGKFKAGVMASYTSSQFTDATNSILPTPNAVSGLIPSYYVIDFTSSYQFKKFGLSASVNNLTNNYYFTRRAEGYPGPGVIPSDGINAYLTVSFKL